ncbi:mutator-like element [Purpureocillium lavendulum]|uniref:Mutator-like element n=1 Tax=Purpureocillium lavendulum TaxID=1247861 RepID=A0AB34FJ68_9HYPO|nr:mutator-like element [Purpureocillium lavendulum]
MSTNQYGIITPANSVEPDPLRNEAAKKAAEQERVANLAQRRKDATSEIERILKCPDDQPREALHVSSDAASDEALKALRKIGCLILPKLLEYSDSPDDSNARKTAEEAFSKLAKAAHEANVASHFIEDVRDWDGHEDLDQKAEPVKQARQAAMPEIHRINNCPADEQTQMLKISGQSPSDDESLEAWRKVGCLIAPIPLKYDEEVEKEEKKAADTAFAKLRKAAEDLGVEERFLSQVELWDGKKDVRAEDEDSEDDEEHRITEDVHPEPPAVIKALYGEATEMVHKLQRNPDDTDALGALQARNANIVQKTNEIPDKKDTVVESTWAINIPWLQVQYKEAHQRYNALLQDTENQTLREEIGKIKDIMDKEIARKFYPVAWTVATPDEAIAIAEGRNRLNYLEPPAVIKELYGKATAAIRVLQGNPDSTDAVASLTANNDDIMRITAEIPNKSPEVTESTWTVNIPWLQEQYTQAWQKYHVFLQDRENQTLRGEIDIMKVAVDEEIARRFYPAEWTVATADQAIAMADSEQTRQDSQQKQLNYPWATQKEGENLILGYKKHGGRGHQVLVETCKDGRYIRRIIAAGDIGIKVVTAYRNDPKALNLVEEQKNWGIEHRESVCEVLWVSQARVQRKNLAAGAKNGDLYAAVTVLENGQQSLKIWTFSTLKTVIGLGDARKEIQRCCERDDIATPWDAGPVEVYYDETRVQQDPKKREEMQEKKSAQNCRFSSSALRSAGRGSAVGGVPANIAPEIKAEETLEGGGVNGVAGGKTDESRLDRLEAAVKEMSTSVFLMQEGMAKFFEMMAGNAKQKDDRRR